MMVEVLCTMCSDLEHMPYPKDRITGATLYTSHPVAGVGFQGRETSLRCVYCVRLGVLRKNPWDLQEIFPRLLRKGRGSPVRALKIRSINAPVTG